MRRSRVVVLVGIVALAGCGVDAASHVTPPTTVERSPEIKACDTVLLYEGPEAAVRCFDQAFGS